MIVLSQGFAYQFKLKTIYIVSTNTREIFQKNVKGGIHVKAFEKG